MHTNALKTSSKQEIHVANASSSNKMQYSSSLSRCMFSCFVVWLLDVWLFGCLAVWPVGGLSVWCEIFKISRMFSHRISEITSSII